MTEHMETIRDERVIAAEINTIKKQAARQMLGAAVEIGRLLCEAKAQVPFGEWGKWLEENVAYSQSNANNLMRLYQNYGEQEQMGFFEENRMELFGELTPSQALALLALPQGERKAFVETHDMENTSVRDIEAEIKAREAAEQAAARLREEKEALARSVQAKEKAAEESQRAAAAAEKKRAAAERALSDERARFRQELAEAQKAAAEAAGQVTVQATVEPDEEELQKRLAEQAGKLEAEYNEKLRAERAAAEAKLQTVGNAAVQEFSVHFEIFQREYDTLLGACGRLQTDNRETADKLQGALAALLHRMAERLQTEENGEGSGNNATA